MQEEDTRMVIDTSTTTEKNKVKEKAVRINIGQENNNRVDD